MSLPPFQSVVDLHGRAVWRYLAAVAGPTDAPDCYQETLVSALRAYPRLAHGSNLRGWLFTIAHRKALDSHRARSRRAVPVGAVPERAAPPPPAGDDAGLWDAVRALPPKQRGAVVARYVGDLPYAEIAEILGCTEDAARQNVRAGLERLRKELT